ncbi:uncharacterized protein Ecym_8062 [Eremothecium cymbalariae DBVPG|uniref:Uncharacterized protein n=1 Tax=Eremothecium cymbalariae (strain CBS 270.75 / DBVPG 7215 / KCTC 17166 / NRRL Y-17582) TaxID=931890 RepID=G8JWY4_ERECY|nr:Hypothetical protein Ecym_8062 [Eremothecium cymbalariae DBVPG\
MKYASFVMAKKTISDFGRNCYFRLYLERGTAAQKNRWSRRKPHRSITSRLWRSTSSLSRMGTRRTGTSALTKRDVTSRIWRCSSAMPIQGTGASAWERWSYSRSAGKRRATGNGCIQSIDKGLLV